MAKMKKPGMGTLLYFRPVASSSDADWLVLHFATEHAHDDGEAEEVDVTTHSSLNAEAEMGLYSPGEFSASCLLDFNVHGTTVTGESRLNGAQPTLYNARGTNTVFSYRLVFAKVGDLPAITATPPTDRSYISGTASVKSFSITAPVEGASTAEITFLRRDKPTLVTVV